MAKMKDPKPVRPGEAKAWQCFADGLPKNYIVYFNRSVYTWEFDFCILAPKQGLFIVEVKGWSPDYVVNVLNSNQINLKGEEEPVGSPRSQARAYCFDLVKLLKNKYGFNPLVLDMVCYPEISKEDYYKKRLDVVSDEYETIFKEELEDPQMLLFLMNFYLHLVIWIIFCLTKEIRVPKKKGKMLLSLQANVSAKKIFRILFLQMGLVLPEVYLSHGV